MALWGVTARQPAVALTPAGEPVLGRPPLPLAPPPPLRKRILPHARRGALSSYGPRVGGPTIRYMVPM